VNEFFITFGYGQHDEAHGSLAKCGTWITAVSENAARRIISAVRGEKWCNSYSREEGAVLIARFGIREIPFNEIGPQIGANL